MSAETNVANAVTRHLRSTASLRVAPCTDALSHGVARDPIRGRVPLFVSDAHVEVSVALGRTRGLGNVACVARTHMAAQPGFLGLRMHRAVAADARIRFISYASWEGKDAYLAALRQPPMDVVRSQMAGDGIRANVGLFDVIHEMGTIEQDSSSVLMISGFELPAASEESFLAEFAETKAHMTSQPGFLALRLHRAITPDARFRFVDIARWESAESFWTALRSPGMQALLARPFWKSVPYFAGIVEVVEQRGTI